MAALIIVPAQPSSDTFYDEEECTTSECSEKEENYLEVPESGK